ncbi:MAG: phosphoglycerate dehydrogenase-like enzyme [Parasphingorhabdus sp.]|jgi:phosphoglycerate dehydrogenase-like enzyme
MSTKFRVLCAMTQGFEKLVIQCKGLGDVEFIDALAIDSLDQIENLNAVIAYAGRYTEELSQTVNRTRPKWIHLVTAGIDPLLKFPPPINTSISSSGYVWSATVAEHAIALLLALLRGLKPGIDLVKSNSWDRTTIMPKLSSIRHARILIIGYGSIGRQISKQLQGFEVEITGLARTARTEIGVKVFAMHELDNLITENDIVINCLPLCPATQHVLSGTQFNLMRNDTIFIDVSRGGVVDEIALLEGLCNGRPAAAGLDVFEVEPLAITHALRELDNVILTPHIAGFGSQQVIDDMAIAACDNLSDVLANNIPRDSLDLNQAIIG